MWHHAYYGHSGGSWLGHTLVSAIIHGLIYGAVFRLMRGMSIGEALLTAGFGVAFISVGWWLWNRRRQ